jgi:hypothetical protein
MERLCPQIGKPSRIVGETYHSRKNVKSVAESLVSLAAQVQTYDRGSNPSPHAKEKDSSKEVERPRETTRRGGGKEGRYDGDAAE